MKFSNEPTYFFKNINLLPNIIVDMIYAYIPISETMFLTKTNYIENHHLIRGLVNKIKIEQYIRTMVIQDNYFVFHQLLVENSKRWLDMKKYYHKECIYGNYLHFLESYAVDNRSIRCKNIITLFLEEQGLSKNQHKKNAVRYIRWKV
jgi:hypothetical protein